MVSIRTQRSHLEQERQFEAHLEAHRGIVFKVAASYSRDREDREDLVQEIVLQLWRAFPSYQEARPFSTWMYRVALNVAITFARRSRPRAETLSEDIATAQKDSRSEALQHCLEQLDDLSRALMLLYLEERGYAEIAEILGLSETNVGAA